MVSLKRILAKNDGTRGKFLNFITLLFFLKIVTARQKFYRSYLCLNDSSSATFFSLRPLVIRGKKTSDLIDLLWPAITVPIFDSEMVILHDLCLSPTFDNNRYLLARPR